MLVLKPPPKYRLRADLLTFTPDGRALTACPSPGVALWTAFTDGARPDVIPLPASSWTGRIVFTPDGATAFAGHARLYAVDVAARTAVQVPTEEWKACGFGVSPDETRLVVAEELHGSADTRLSCWAVGAYDRPLWQFVIGSHIHDKPTVFPPTGDRFVHPENIRDPLTRRWRTRAVTRSLTDGAVLAESEPYPEFVEQFILSPDGATAAARIREKIYTGPVTGAVSAAGVANDNRKHFTGIAFHPSGRYLAATSNDATVKLFDTATWEVARTFTWNIGKMRSVAFSPDGTLAAAGSDSGKVVVWDADL